MPAAEGGEEEEAAEAVLVNPGGVRAGNESGRAKRKGASAPSGGGLAAGTGGGRGGRAPAQAALPRVRHPRAPVGSRPEAERLATSRPTVRLPSARRTAGQAASPPRPQQERRPGGDIEFARGRWKRRPGDGVATAAASRRTRGARPLGDGQRRRVTTTRGGGVGTRGGVGTGDFALGAVARAASRRARLVAWPVFSRPWARGPRSARRRSARSRARLADVVLGSPQRDSGAGARAAGRRHDATGGGGGVCASGRAR